MKKKKALKPLTELQEKFVDAFCGEHFLDPIASYDAAGYAHTYNKPRDSMAVLKSPAVEKAVMERLQETSIAYWINESVIIQKLWEEANTVTGTQAARINALVWIGKHIGMWKEKEERQDTQPIIEITQYGVPKEELHKKLKDPEVEENKDKVSLPEGVTVLDYSDKQH